MELSGDYRRKLHQALMSTFPSEQQLDSVLQQELGLHLKQIAYGDNYQIIVFNLIRYLESQGRLNELIQVAARTNPGIREIPELVRPQFSDTVAKLTLRRIPRTGQGYVEPLLEVADALPLHMVLIPGGTFTMGSPEDERDRDGSEGLQHEVTVSQFFMSRYPITQAQWRAVATLPQVKQELNPDPSHFKGNDRPVEQVSWYDAVEFCDLLAQHTKRPYRLPSEAEWEYACRAGTKTPFYFGKTLTSEVANYRATFTYADGPEGDYRGETTPVNELGIANAFGLSDMHGNVWEWCQDHWHENYEGAPTDGSAWLSSGEGSLRIRRGGSWSSNPWNCRSAYRNRNTPGSRNNSRGFRVCCSAPRTP